MRFKGLWSAVATVLTVVMPDEKPKGGELSQQQRERNKAIASIRVKVEHAISVIKRLRIVKDKVQAWAKDLRDQIMEIACGSQNFRLRYRPWNYPKTNGNLQT